MTKILIEKNATEYFDVDGPIIACVGMMADSAMFKLKTLANGRSEWELLPDNSTQFDYYHQGIYRNHRATFLAEDEIESLADLPLQIPSKLEIKENLETPINSFLVSDHGNIAEFLKKQARNEYSIYAVLHEDLYETNHGDGCYRYLTAVFLEKVDAQNLIAQINSDRNFLGHLRLLTLELKQDRIEIVDLNKETFDHYDSKAILDLLNRRCDPCSAIANVEEQYAGIPHRLLDQYDGGVAPTKEDIDELLKVAPMELQSRAKVFIEEKMKKNCK